MNSNPLPAAKEPVGSPAPAALPPSPAGATGAAACPCAANKAREQVAAPFSILESRALADVVNTRLEQIVAHDHGAEADAARDFGHFTKQLQTRAIELERQARFLAEDHQFRTGPERLRRNAVKLCALALAFIDRIDADPQPETPA